MTMVAFLVALVLFHLCLSSEARAQTPANGERLFIQKGCIGCHGVSGRGGAGPDLAGTALSLDQFVKQLRTPRA